MSVLKYIEVSELSMGMYIEELGGNAVNNSIWKNGFLLQNEHDLKRIHGSGIAGLWINACKGIDVSKKPSANQSISATVQHVLVKELEVPVSFEQEASRAAELCARSRAAVEEMFQDLRLGRVIETGNISNLVNEVSDSVMRHPDALISLARLKKSDEYTYMHSVAVCALMIALARQMDLPTQTIHEAGLAGLVHDIGKVAIPIEILNKPGKLLDAEFELMRGHSEAGFYMLQNNPLFGPQVLDVCLHHHEKFDGTGYPHHLSGSQISLLARMGAICDVYDAITSNRPYKKAWEPSYAIHQMAEWKGHFDKKIFQAFVRCIGIYPVGSLVRLHNGEIGVVTEQNKKSLLTPKVRVFICSKTAKKIPIAELDLEALSSTNWIVKRERCERWGLINTDRLWSGFKPRSHSHTDPA